MLRKLSLLVGAAVLASGVLAVKCPSEPIASCTEDASSIDTCCVAHPGGLMVFRQRFEADEGDEGRWGIDGLEIMNCDGTPVPRIPPSAPRAYSQEQVGSFCARAARIGPEYESYESEWAASEVGEGVEEIWERNWRVSGRQISTLEPRCFGSYETGQEVSFFFHALHQLHASLPAWQLLADSNITPSEDITYSLNELVDALSISGFTPYLTCINDTLSAIHWPVNTIGPFQDTTFAPSHFDGSSRSNCPSNGIVYPPAEQIFRPSDYTWDPMARPTMRPLMQVTRASAPAGASVTEVADEAGAKAFAPHEKQVVRKKLGLFKEKDRKMQDQRERQFDDDAKRHKRDEL